MTRHAFHARRGLAMMLVLISLAVATVLATAYLASRDNSVLIGQNVASGSSAKWAALATLKSGLAVLETETDWRNNHTAGVVFTNTAFAGATVELVYLDRLTGNPPTSDTTEVKVIANAEVNGIEETVVAYASVPLPETDPDLDLSEFVVFGKDKVQIKDTSYVTRWYSAPQSSLGRNLAIGTANTAAGAIQITDYAVAMNSTAYAVNSASSMVLSNTGSGTINLVKMPDTIVIPAPPSSGTTAPTGTTSDLTRNAAAPTGLTIDRRYKKITLQNSSILRLRDMTLTADDDVTIESNSVLDIYGDVKFVAHKQFRVRSDAIIQMQPGSSLTIYVGDDLEFDDAEVREAGDSAARNVAGTATWIDPTRVALYGLNSDAKNWHFDDVAMFKGNVYAPNKKVTIDDGSAIYGSVLAREVIVQQASAVFYDDTLNTLGGYTVFDSPIYTEAGTVHDAVKALNTLDPSAVDAVVVAVRPADETPSTVNSSDPTPRTVDISYEIETFSSDMADWESKAVMIAASTASSSSSSSGGSGGSGSSLWAWLFGRYRSGDHDND